MDDVTKQRATMAVMSLLSDVQEMNHIVGTEFELNSIVNFAKFLILKYSHNMEVLIDAEAEYKEFKTKYPRNA